MPNSNITHRTARLGDALTIVWDALATRGYGPHGQAHDFRSRCPGHDGDGRDALHVSRGYDGRALVWCFSHGCSDAEIVERLGLRVRDLFPVELQYRTTRLATARREDFTGNAREVANMMVALERLGERWRVSIDFLGECPSCEWPGAQLVVESGREPFVHCQRECSFDAIKGGLVERLSERRRAA